MTPISPFGVLAVVSVHRDDLEAASAFLARASQYRAVYGHSPPLYLDLAEALLREAAGELGGAVHALQDVFDRTGVLTQNLSIEPTLGPRLVRLAERAGDTTRAAAVADTTDRLARLNPTAASVVASAAHCRGLRSGSCDLLVAAVEQFRDSPRVMARASVLEDAGRALAAAGDRGGGVNYLTQAMELYGRAGAVRDESRVRRRLRGAGVHHRPTRSPSRPRLGWDSLTDAELRVVGHVAQGLTNRQIAERLYLSTHTVATHLKHAFEKLGVSLRARLLEELDYHKEAGNQQRFADLYAGHPFIHIPAVRHDLSTGRVLTTELVRGARYRDVQSWPAEERNLAGEAIFRFVFGCLYRTGAFNGDPPPGNYLFHSGGRVTILDFGLVKWFTEPEVQLLAAMVKSLVVRRSVHAFRQATEQAGFLRPDPTLTDQEVADYFGQYYTPLLADGPTAFSSEYVTTTLRTFFDARNEVVKRANVPAPFVLVQRINLGLYSVLAGFDATADWRRIAAEIWPFVNSPPSTELGAKEATWRANQGCGQIAANALTIGP